MRIPKCVVICELVALFHSQWWLNGQASALHPVQPFSSTEPTRTAGPLIPSAPADTIAALGFLDQVGTGTVRNHPSPSSSKQALTSTEALRVPLA